jgi:hypothetical protein
MIKGELPRGRVDMNDIRKFSILPAASIFFLLGVFASSAYAFSLDGIPTSGEPSFWNNVTIDMNDNGSKNGEARVNIKGRGDFTFKDGSTHWTGEKVIFKLQAFYNDLGDLLSGTIVIKGGIAGLGINKGTTLMTADLIGWNLTEDMSGLNGWSKLWGFATDNIVCNPMLLVQCTQKESVYVRLDGAGFDGDFTNGRYLTSGFAVTTVPVPAAAWLFGSALGLLGWVRSRNRRGAVTA